MPDNALEHFSVPRQLIAEHSLLLRESGRVVVRSGTIASGPFEISLHTDYGPPDQEKPTNQDFTLAWCPIGDASHDAPKWVLAVADGLTDSYASEWAAELACWSAVRSLVESFGRFSPDELGRRAVNAAGDAIGFTVDAYSADLNGSRPTDIFPLTWKYMLRKGKLLQTTLLLAWYDSKALRMISIGDAGAVLYGGAKNQDPDSLEHLLAHCDLQTNLVNAIGPASRNNHYIDCWAERELEGPFICAFYTDGVGRYLNDTPLTMLSVLQDLSDSGCLSLADTFLSNALQNHPEEFSDNVTLATIVRR